MRAVDIPTRFNIPFANAAGPAYIRVVPEASQIGVTPGAASDTDGFPPLNFEPVESGGIPISGADMNGLLNQVTAWVRWMTAGGPSGYNSAFSSAIGGYPAGAAVAAAGAPGVEWVSLVDNNTTDPDTGGAGWALTTPPQAYYTDTGLVNAVVIAPAPAPPSYTAGLYYRFKIGHTITAAATFNAGAGPIALTNSVGAPLQAGDFIAGASVEVLLDSPTVARSLNPTASQLAGGGLSVSATTGKTSVEIHGQTLKASPDLADEIMIWDAGLGVYRKTTANAVAGLAALSSNSFLVARAQALFWG